LGISFESKPGILLRLVSRHTDNPLHIVEGGFWLTALLGPHSFDDLARFRFRKGALLKEVGAILIIANDDLLA